MIGENKLEYRMGLSCQMGGRRSNNEDNFYLNGLYKALDLADSPMQLSASAWGEAVVAVCDGMGGEAYGECAAWEAVTTLANWGDRLRETGRIREETEACIRAMNERVCAERTRRGCRMGTTLVMAILRGERAEVYNVGDSRAYLASGGRLTQLSVDHTAAQALLSMGLSPTKKGREYHQLTQYLGIPEAELVLEASWAEAVLKPGDRLLLCSDGLTDMLDENRLAFLLSDRAAPAVQALRLTREAERAGGKDNVTALVLAVGPFEKDERGERL